MSKVDTGQSYHIQEYVCLAFLQFLYDFRFRGRFWIPKRLRRIWAFKINYHFNGLLVILRWMILSQHVLKKIGCFYTPLNGIPCYTLKYVISTVFNRFKSSNMNLEAKIIAEIVFFTEFDYLEYVRNERKQRIKNRRKTQKKIWNFKLFSVAFRVY